MFMVFPNLHFNLSRRVRLSIGTEFHATNTHYTAPVRKYRAVSWERNELRHLSAGTPSKFCVAVQIHSSSMV